MVSPSFSEETLCNVFAATLSIHEKERREAETFLATAQQEPSVLVRLARIVACAEVDKAIRTSAAVYLKNTVRIRCTEGENEAKWIPVLTEAEKNEVFQHLYSLLAALIAEEISSSSVVPLRKSIQASLRLLIYSQMRNARLDMLPRIIEGLKKRSDMGLLYAAIIALRFSLDAYESLRDDLEKDCLPALDSIFLALGRDLSRESCMSNAVSAALLKQACKVYWAYVNRGLSSQECCVDSFDGCMELFLYASAATVPKDALKSNDLEASPQFKVKQHVIKSLCHYLAGCSTSSSNTSQSREKALKQRFVTHWAGRFAEASLLVLHCYKSGQEIVPDALAGVTLEYLAESVTFAVTYKLVKPHTQFLLFEVCFPALCYSPTDIELWTSDPNEFIRQRESFFDHSLRDSALLFVNRIVRHRSRDTLSPITKFTHDIFLRCASATSGEQQKQFYQKKDGAFCLLGCIANRLLSKKRDFDLESFFKQFVYPELTNAHDPFLRLRACWMYRTFFDSQYINGLHLKDAECLISAFHHILTLCGDADIVIRTEAAGAVNVFFCMQDDRIREAVTANVPQIIQVLLQTVASVQDSELAVDTLESLVVNFGEHIQPYSVQLVQSLSSVFINMISSTDDEDAKVFLNPFTVLQAIDSVMESIADPQYHEMFAVMAPAVVPMLQSIFSPAGIDFLQDGFEVLKYLVRFSTSVSSPMDLWLFFDIFVDAVFGGKYPEGSDDSLLKGWDVEDIQQMIPVIECLMVRDASRFATGVSTAYRKPYKLLFLDTVQRLLKKNETLDGECYAVELGMLLFRSFIGKAPAIDDMMVPCFELLWGYFKSLGTEKSEAVHISESMSQGVRQLCTMILYNITGFMALLNQVQLKHDVLTVLLKDASCVASVEGKKTVVLCYAHLLDFLTAQSTAEPQLLSTLIKALAEQLSSYYDAARRFEQMQNDSDDDTYDTIDSEQDLNDEEDAHPVDLPDKLVRKLCEMESEDTDAQSYDYVSEFPEEGSLSCSPLKDVNVMDVVSRLFVQHSSAFFSVLGEQGIGKMKELLHYELEKKQTQPCLQ